MITPNYLHAVDGDNLRRREMEQMKMNCVRCNRELDANQVGDYICPNCLYNTMIDGPVDKENGRTKVKSGNCPHCGKSIKVTVTQK